MIHTCYQPVDNMKANYEVKSNVCRGLTISTLHCMRNHSLNSGLNNTGSSPGVRLGAGFLLMYTVHS